jgi:hypothetical protein
LKNVKLFGAGCANCKNILKLIETAAIEKSVDGKLAHAGGVPSRDKMSGWL